jgi:CHASE2 domain-containing sensor protein
MGNATAEGISFFEGYWNFSMWALIVIAVVFVLMTWPMRRPGKAFAVLLLGVYATMAWYFLTIYEQVGFDIEYAVGLVILAGLVIGATFYYFVFIRTG